MDNENGRCHRPAAAGMRVFAGWEARGVFAEFEWEESDFCGLDSVQRPFQNSCSRRAYSRFARKNASKLGGYTGCCFGPHQLHRSHPFGAPCRPSGDGMIGWTQAEAVAALGVEMHARR